MVNPYTRISRPRLSKRTTVENTKRTGIRFRDPFNEAGIWVPKPYDEDRDAYARYILSSIRCDDDILRGYAKQIRRLRKGKCS